MKRFIVLIVMIGMVVLLVSCEEEEPIVEPVVEDTIEVTYEFDGRRTEYLLNITTDGTLVVHNETMEELLVPFGEEMLFDDVVKYSKDTLNILHNTRAHAETYVSWEESVELPVDFLRTGAYYWWDDMTAIECMADRFNSPHQYPDQSDKVIVAYINTVEYDGDEGLDAAFDPDWDKDNDGFIDDDIGDLPDYVAVDVRNNAWNGYVAAYWTESWYEVMEQRIDLVAAEHFDGIMLDVMDGAHFWVAYELSKDEDGTWEEYIGIYRERVVELIEHISTYSREKYGTAFLITGNLDWGSYEYFDTLSDYVDGGYHQNAVFSWTGSGGLEGAGLSAYEDRYYNERLEYLKNQGLPLLNMDHLGHGVNNNYDWGEYDEEGVVTMKNFLFMFDWAIASGSTPYVSPVMFSMPFDTIHNVSTIDTIKNQELAPNAYPRFTRVLDGVSPFTNTEYNDWVIGTDSGDELETGPGDDLVYVGAGDNYVDLGEGFDGTYYLGNREDYTIEIDDSITVTSLIHDIIDVFTSIEYIIFADMVVVIGEPEIETKLVDVDSVLPSDIEKVNVQDDPHPPILHSEEFEMPVPLPYPVNTSGAEDSPFILPDGNTLYYFFTPDVRKQPQEQLLDGATGIWVATKVDGVWTESRRVWLQEVGKLALDGAAFVRDDEMWFASAREGYTGVNLFTSNKENGVWSIGEYVGDQLMKDYMVGEMHIHEDTIYYHSDREGGLGSFDIWTTTKVNGEWQEPVSVDAVNTTEMDGFPFISSDGEELWFTRTYLGTPAVYRSIKVDGEWQTPELIVSQFAGEPTLDDEGNLYFVHHYFKDGVMIEADIYVAYKR